MLILETARLILREFIAADWDAINAIVADPQVARYMHFSRWDEARRRAWFDGMLAEQHTPPRTPYNWAITLREGSALIGWLYIGGAPPADAPRGFGYALAASRWGRGYMNEALAAVFHYEFETLGTQQIVGECETPNTASARVMGKCGMRSLGEFYCPDFEGHWAHELHYAISREEYVARQAGG